MRRSPAELCSIDLRDEAEWLDACGAVYETATVPASASRGPLSVIFVPGTGRAGVAGRGEARWLHASDLDDAVARYLRGEGSRGR
ncbi:MAG: hypothetical protein ACRELB_12290 [Polyangiaceae bacterium]